MHKRHIPRSPHYMVIAKVVEPDYKAEWLFIDTERAYVERQLHAKRHWATRWLRAHSLGFYGHSDWKRYAKQLDDYEAELAKYAHEVEAGVLPVKFAVWNDYNRTDRVVHVNVRVHGGKVDEGRKPPSRPERLDTPGKMGKALRLPDFTGFTRRGIRVTEHHIEAELSSLGAHDGAVLINQIVHIHCTPDTEVSYEVQSQNVHHEVGDVELTNAPTVGAATS